METLKSLRLEIDKSTLKSDSIIEKGKLGCSISVTDVDSHSIVFYIYKSVKDRDSDLNSLLK